MRIVTIFLLFLTSYCFGQSPSIIAAAQINNYGGNHQYDELPLLLNADNVFFFSSHKERSLYQQVTLETGVYTTGVPLTQAKYDNNTVGFMYDLGPNALKATAASNTPLPILASDATKNTSFYFSGSKYLRILNSTSICKNFHATDQEFSIFLWAKKGVDGTVMVLMANSTGSTAAYGFYLGTTAANKLAFQVTWGAAGNASMAITSTATWTVADGWTPIIITVAGTGAGNGTLYIGDKTPETFTVDNEGATNLATGLVTFGATSSLGSFFTGYMDCFGAQNRVLTTDEINDFKAYNPDRTTANFRTLELQFDFNDESTMWADVAKTTPITDGTAIARVTNTKTSNFGPRTDDLTQSTAGSRPLYQSNVVNGLGVAEYDGVDNTLVFVEPTERGGSFVIFFVIKNLDATYGSRPIYSYTDSYFVLTGENYIGGLTSPYCVLHHEIGTEDNPSVELSNGLSYEVFGVRRDQNLTTLFTVDGTSVRTSIRQWQLSELGKDASGLNNWWMHGDFGMIEKYNGWMTDVEMMERLNEIYNLYN